MKIFAPATGLDNDGLDMFAREFSLVADVNDPNILKPLYFESERKPYLVLQYCRQGSLKKKISNIDEPEAWKIIHDVAKGLKALHSHVPPIVHQDIKPENIMIADDGHYMITDFGVSVHLRTTIRRTMSSSLTKAGTKAYMAPERFGKGRLTPIMPSDVWSLGAMVFELLVGEVPFGEEGGISQKSGYEIPDLPEQYSTDLCNIIEQCLAEKPSDRPFVEDLEALAAQHLTAPTPQPHVSKGPTSKPDKTPSNPEPLSKLEPSKPIKIFDVWFWGAILAGAVTGTLLAFLY